MNTTFVQIQNGKFSLDDLRHFFNNAGDGLYRVEVHKVRKARTLDQNAWLWGCIYPTLLQALQNEGWEFVTTDEVHEFFKELFAKRQCINKHTGEVVEIGESTAAMTTLEFSEYCEMLRAYAVEFLNTDIPDPDRLWNEQKQN